MFIYSDNIPRDESIKLPEPIRVFDPTYVHTERKPLYQSALAVLPNQLSIAHKEALSEEQKKSAEIQALIAEEQMYLWRSRG